MSRGRYWLFAGSDYYPAGGMNDFINHSNSKDELFAVADMKTAWNPEKHEYDWYHVLDVVTGDVFGGTNHRKPQPPVVMRRVWPEGEASVIDEQVAQ